MSGRISRIVSYIVLVLSIIFATVSCSSIRKYVFSFNEGIDESIQTYVDKVNAMNNGAFSKVDDISFYNESPSKADGNYTIGYCAFNFTTFKPFVKINTHWWNNANDKERILLTAHELRHCACKGKKMMHIDGTEGTFSCPKHYMHFQMANRLCIMFNYNKYVDQIKKGCED